MNFAATGYWFRVLISALIVGCLTTGTAIQMTLQDGKPPSKWQLYSAILGGTLVFLNDIKSRITPPSGKE